MAIRSWQVGAAWHQGFWSVALLLVAVLVPTACVLWFMTEAMRNERLAVRQKLTVVYRSHLIGIERQLDAGWAAKHRALSAVDPGAPAAEVFAELVGTGVADSVIVFDSSGRVMYPAAASGKTPDAPPASAEWLAARKLEFENVEYDAAARAYARIAEESVDANRTAQALLAQARCLIKAGQQPRALEILIDSLGGDGYRSAVGADGVLIAANAQLLALRLLDDPTTDLYGRTFKQLASRLNDYEHFHLPADQRCFLMQELQAMRPDGAEFPTLAAERLAADYLASEPSPASSGALQTTPMDTVWHWAVPDTPIVALFRRDRLVVELQSRIDVEDPLPDVTITLVPPGSDAAAVDGFLDHSAGRYLPDWKLSLRLAGADPLAAAADRRVTVYLWSGILVIAVIALLAVGVARYVGTQMRITRLRNDLLATVSHELKTPLSSIRALAETLSEGRYADQQTHDEYLQLITQENERLTRLIDNFLAFSRMERNKRAFELTELEIEPIAKAAVDAVRKRFDAPGCQLDVEIAPNLPAIAGDLDALTTALVNLLDNAYKYTGDHKHVTLRASANGRNICLEVRDNGIGLTRRAAKRVFDRFYQVDQRLSRGAEGCGLGLSIVQFIVAAHGGVVSVESEPGKGSTFTIKLPVAATATSTQA